MVEEQKSQYVFLVDDEPIQNELLQDHLSQFFGYQFKQYDSAEAAIKDLNLNPYIVVLDYHLNSHLPKAINGIEALKQIKAAKPNTKVVMLSGQDKLEVAVDSMKFGAFDYVIKGQTAFSRMEMIFHKMIDFDKIKTENNKYKKTLYLVYVGYGLLLFYTLIRLMIDNSGHMRH